MPYRRLSDEPRDVDAALASPRVRQRESLVFELVGYGALHVVLATFEQLRHGGDGLPVDGRIDDPAAGADVPA